MLSADTDSLSNRHEAAPVSCVGEAASSDVQEAAPVSCVGEAASDAAAGEVGAEGIQLNR